MPEVNLLLALFNKSDKYVPILFDEAGQSQTLDMPDSASKLTYDFQATVSQHNT